MTSTAPLHLSTAPYPGLRTFKHTEADIFFGREEQTDQLLKRLQTSHFLAVVGPSGCGKSSLVRAGMISALVAGFLTEAGARWRIAEMRPGERPLGRLAEALLSPLALGPELGNEPDTAAFLQATLRRGPLGVLEAMREMPLFKYTSLLLLVDQFEEIFRFRQEGDADEADAFVALLLATAKQSEIPVYIVITMRSDYLGDCALFSGLPEAMNESQFLTPRLSREQSGAAIAKPARVFDGRVDPALVNRLLNDMGSDSDQLPLLQHCLMRMWTRATKPLNAEPHSAPLTNASTAIETTANGSATITLDDYKAVGGLEEALSKHADEVLSSLTDEQQRIAQVLFRRLTERSPGRRDTRRPSRLDDVAQVAGVETKEVATVVKEFRQPDRSFITPPHGSPLKPDTVLDISHESLIRLWHTLDEWVNKEARSAAAYERLKQTAHLWEANDADLLGTINLERAVAWKEEQKPTLAWARRYGSDEDFASTMAFLAASEREWNDQQRRLEAERERQQQEEVERQSRQEREKRLEEGAKAAKRFKKLSIVLAGVVLLAASAAVWGLILTRQARAAMDNVEKANQKIEDEMKNAEHAREEAEDARRKLEVLKSKQILLIEKHLQEAGKAKEALNVALQKAKDEAAKANEQRQFAEARSKDAIRAQALAQENLRKYQKAEQQVKASDLAAEGYRLLDQNPQKALGDFQQAIDFYEKNNDPEMLVDLYADAGVASDRLGQYEQALGYFQKAEPHLRETEDWSDLAILLIYMGLDYKKLGNSKEAANALSEGIPLLLENDNREDAASMLIKVGDAYSAGNNDSKKEALKYLQQVLDLFGSGSGHDVDESKVEVLTKMGKIHQALGNQQQAEDFFKRATEIQSRIKSKEKRPF
jgi:tetratricopeptide (TPR) repeat protein